MIAIAGVDVGNTTAIVLVDENRQIISKKSKKNFGEKEIIEYLSKNKDIVLLATDKQKIPSKIKKIAARLNLAVFSPKEDLEIKYKTQLYKKYDLDNDHERDALAAALYALEKNLEIIKKTFRIENDKERIVKILRDFFKNPNEDPTTIQKKIVEELKIKEKSDKEKQREIQKEKKNVVKRKIYRLPKIRKDKILLKKIKLLKNQIKEFHEKYLDLYTKYIKLSKYLLTDDLIVPKLSFVKNIKKIEKVFIDKVNEKKYIQAKQIYVPNEEILKLINYPEKSEIYLVENFEDLETFVRIISCKRLNIDKSKDSNKEIEKLKDLIVKYRFGNAKL